jgi:hypothetical protein
MVKVNLTVRVPAEVRQLIEDLAKRYGMGMGDIIAFVFNEFRDEIIKRLERMANPSAQSVPGSPGSSSGDVISRLMDEYAQPTDEEGLLLKYLMETQGG